jgi:hypothetical protein|mmetsp:Transcript_18739/g.33996  ORF Transcript_18739/g.33996 Transcript_18739/m.33996 type:complete len:142 (-) Transcript_18739:1018-1443(-)
MGYNPSLHDIKGWVCHTKALSFIVPIYKYSSYTLAKQVKLIQDASIVLKTLRIFSVQLTNERVSCLCLHYILLIGTSYRSGTVPVAQLRSVSIASRVVVLIFMKSENVKYVQVFSTCINMGQYLVDPHEKVAVVTIPDVNP